VLTYAQLIAEIDGCAATLQSHGLRAMSQVAAVLPNGPEMVVGFLAATTVSAFAPLNPNYRPAEFAYYLDDLQAELLITLAGENSACREVASARGIPVLELPPLAGGSGNEGRPNLAHLLQRPAVFAVISPLLAARFGGYAAVVVAELAAYPGRHNGDVHGRHSHLTYNEI
jgi:acyl-CoA synthetase (AMP-forming)/AMP-acid ligase II